MPRGLHGDEFHERLHGGIRPRSRSRREYLQATASENIRFVQVHHLRPTLVGGNMTLYEIIVCWAIAIELLIIAGMRLAEMRGRA
jgi:hypothetical protein